MAFCKIIGWKSVLYPTTDPFLMLKLGAEVMEIVGSEGLGKDRLLGGK